MRRVVFALGGACLTAVLCLSVWAQNSPERSVNKRQKANEDQDPSVIMEVGVATNWNFSGGAATFAPNLAAEVTPIENWLELEAGVSPFFTRNSTNRERDLISGVL